MKKIIYLLKKFKQYLLIYNEIIFQRKKLIVNDSKKLAFILFGANYCNLGDIAITVAQKNFLINNLPKDYEVITINVDDTLKYYLDLKRKLKSDSIITLIGGGNHGDIYEFIDYKRRFILKKFKNSKIVSFPQTVVYSNSYIGLKKKKEFIKNAKSIKNLYVVAREKNSFNKYKEMNLSNILLTPDIVFSLNEIFRATERKGIGLILRNDKEKSLDIEFQKKLINELEKYSEEKIVMDTCGYNIDFNDYNDFLYNYIKKVSSKKLVITDRLHGMIFCYITNTPCIVFNNNNDKIISTYNTWLLNQNFIILSDIYDKNIINKIDELLSLSKIEKEDLTDKFQDLVKVVKEYGTN